jgi:hypothetical protein
MVARIILGASALLAVATAQNVNNNIANADGLELVPEALQIGSTLDGTDALGASDEQVASRISNNNFINFCAGETLTNGLQITEGSCNGIRKWSKWSSSWASARRMVDRSWLSLLRWLG